MGVRYYPKGFVGIEQGALLVAKLKYRDNWQHLLPSEAEMWSQLGHTLNAEALLGHMGEVFRRARLNDPTVDTSGAVERVGDYNEVLNLLRQTLHAGELTAEYCDENGKFGHIRSESWGGDGALDVLRSGVAWLDEDPSTQALRLVLLRTESLLKCFSLRDTDQQATLSQSQSPENAVLGTQVGRPKGGRPEEYDWPRIREFARQTVQKFGKPGRANKMLPTKEDLVRVIQEDCANRDLHPSAPNVRKRLAQWLEEF